MSKLFNCPFCNGEPIESNSPIQGQYLVKCLDCGVTMSEDRKDKVSALWNNRVNDWIPVSERLPEETDVYIATVVNRNIDPPFVQEVKYNAQYKDWNTFFKVLAWMPRPKPYQP